MMIDKESQVKLLKENQEALEEQRCLRGTDH